VSAVRIGGVKAFVPITDRNPHGYKALIAGENHHIDIGKWGMDRQGFVATRFEVNQYGWRPVWEREGLVAAGHARP
jgi:hypothetical protein